MQTIDFKKIFAQQNRGILLDIVVFLINLLLMQILPILSRKLVYQAEQDVFAKLAIGLFFAGLFFLQPLGPVLKRWSFHQRFKFESNSTAGCLLFWFMWVYLVMMILISGAATIILTEVFFERGSPASQFAPGFILAGVVLSVVTIVFIYRYFVRPTKETSLEIFDNAKRRVARRRFNVSQRNLSSDSLELLDGRDVFLGAPD